MTQRYQKNHPAENVSYYHHIFCAAIAHPDHKIALPPAQEPIMRNDGTTTNDCEHNGAKGTIGGKHRRTWFLAFYTYEARGQWYQIN